MGKIDYAVPATHFIFIRTVAHNIPVRRHRDHSGGWYHLVITCDVTQSSYADRYKVYVNNFLNTSSSGTIAQNTDLDFQ